MDKMNNTQIDKRLTTVQKNELTERIVYHKLYKTIKNTRNREVLLQISRDELRHYYLWKSNTERVEEPNWFRIWLYYLISKIFGITFGIRLMER